jgi:hypothetical protein
MIPIYRAKMIDSNEYVVGWLKTCTDTGVILWIQTRDWIDYQIDESTLAIHFPDMLDIQGNKIFASLSEDGRGGSIFNFEGEAYVVIFCIDLSINAFEINSLNSICPDSLYEWRNKDFKDESKKYDLKVIGIQE